MNSLFHVTINDISAIYVTAHRCAGGLEEVGPTIGLPTQYIAFTVSGKVVIP